MRRIQTLILALSVMAAGAMAQSTNVNSVNVVGYTTVTVPSNNGLVLVSLNLESVSGQAMCISNLVGDQLPVNSWAHIWDRTKNGYYSTSKTRSGWGSIGTSNIMRGDAFWLQNGSLTANYVVVFSGEVPDSTLEATTTVSQISQVDAVGYPYPADILWTNTTLAKNSLVGDWLHVWNGAGYVSYSKTRGGWGVAETNTIRLGQGFWFQTTNTVAWTESVPYNLSQ